jgi:hypothetical protein
MMKPTTRWRAGASTVIAAGALALAVLIPAVTANAEPDGLSAVRQATAAFHDIGLAEAAGYHPLLTCFDQPGAGMGQHYANRQLFDGSVDPLHPEALVYQVRDNRLQLVAVEYIIPMPDWNGLQAPILFGQAFTPIPSLEIWALHAWIWRPNPSGMFANYNPDVPPCPR